MLYLYNLYTMYIYMRNMYGIYITYRFFKWLFGSSYDFFCRIYNFLYTRKDNIKMIEDKKY